MAKTLIRDTFRFLANIPGWRTKRKIVVFESDDWGSIRMPSIKTFEYLKSKGLDLASGDALRYNLNDSLATSDDLAALFEVLFSFKDKNGRSCVFTPLCLVANPDFGKIKSSGFYEYYYEPFTETFKKYPGCENSFDLWKQGMNAGIFIPQFHGREHLNVKAWMQALKSKHKETMLAFEKKMWAISLPDTVKAGGYQAAFLIENMDELEDQRKIIEEGLLLFEKIFGYKACYFVPPNSYFNNSLEEITKLNGIKYLGTTYIQKESLGQRRFKNRYHYLGQQNIHKQSYIIRNALFEPNQNNRNDLNECLKRIKIAFSLNKPAIISTHRTNFIGALNLKNRDNGLRELKKLLKEIIVRFPEVEFMTTAELGELMNKGNG